MTPGIVRKLLAGYSYLLVVFLLLPQLVVVAVSVNPTQRMVISWSSASFRWYEAMWQNPDIIRAFWLSLAVALVSSLFSTLLGGLAAYATVRWFRKGKQWLTALFVAPLLMPATALGVALYMAMNLVGATATVPGLVVSHVVVTIPYTFKTLFTAIEGLDFSLEEAAQSLGASGLTVAWRVIVPLIRPGLATAALFSFIVSLEEFTVSLFVTERSIRTVPLEIYNATEYGLTPMVAAASTILIALSIAAVFILSKVVGLGRAYQVNR